MLAALIMIAGILLIRNAVLEIAGLLLAASAEAYLFLPIVKPLEKRIPQTAAIILAFLLVLAVNVSAIVLVIPVFSQQIKTFAAVLPDYIESIRAFVYNYAGGIPYISEIIEKIEVKTSVFGFLDAWLTRFSPSAAISFFATSLLLPVLMFYMLKDREKIRSRCLFFLPGKLRTPVMYLFRDINRQLRDYVSGQIIITVIVSALMACTLGVFGFDYWLILGIIMGIFNIIPYVGPLLGSVPIILVASTRNKIVLALILILAVQQIDNLIVHPFVISESVKMHPVTVLLCVVAGNSVGSFLGMVLAIPAFIILRILFKEFYKFFTERKRNFPKLVKI